MTETPAPSQTPVREPEGEAPDRAARRKRRIIISAVLGFIFLSLLWIAHLRLGLFLYNLDTRWCIFQSQAQWMGANLPLWLVGNGLLHTPGDGGLRWLKPRGIDALPYYLEVLAERRGMAKVEVISLIRDLGPEAAEAVPLLERALRDPHDWVRVNAAAALLDISPGSEAALEELRRAVRSREQGVAYFAMHLLGESQTVDEIDIDVLIEQLQSSDMLAGQKAFDLVEKMGADAKPAIKTLMTILTVEEDYFKRERAASALCNLATFFPELVPVVLRLCERRRQIAHFPASRFSPIVRRHPIPPKPEELKAAKERDARIPALMPYLERSLKAPDKYERRGAVKALGSMGPMALDAVPQIIPLLKDEDNATMNAAAHALARIAEAVPAVVTQLRETGRTDDAKLRAGIALALANTHGASAKIASELPAELNSNDRNKRLAALELLNGGPEANIEAIPALVRMLDDNDREIRNGAGKALGWIVSRSPEGLPALLTPLKSVSHRARVAIEWALRHVVINSPEGKKKLYQLVDKAEPDIRASVVLALGMDQDEKRAVPFLIGKCTDSFDMVRINAAKALARQCAGNKGLVGQLSKALERFDDQTRAGIILAFGDLDPVPPAVLPLLVEALGSESHELSGNASFGLKRMGPTAAPAVLDLIAMIRKEDEARPPDRHASHRAIGILGDIGPEARPAVPLLVNLLDRRIELEKFRTGMLREAVETLGKIGPDAAEAVPMLVSMYAPEKFFGMRGSLVAALARIAPKDEGTREIILAALNDKSSNVRFRGAVAAGEAGLTHAIPLVEAAAARLSGEKEKRMYLPRYLEIAKKLRALQKQEPVSAP
ncbi:HEAT repeat domain-containing protein [Planctomycetota bacterium]